MESETYAWIEVVKIWLQSHWDSIRDFGNSTFFTSIAGAFAGAWAGGRIAQVLAIRAKDKEDLTREIRNTNAAAAMASALCDSFAGMLSQNVKPTKEKYEADLASYSAWTNSPSGTQEPQQRIVANLKSFSGPQLDTDILQQLLFSGVSSSGKVIRVFAALNQAISNIKITNDRRNQLIEEFRGANFRSEEMECRYFGIRDSKGRIDESYKSVLATLYTSLGDGIYFAMNLTLLLASHAEELGRRYKEAYGLPVPQVIKLEFSRLNERGIMPDSKNYPDWDVLLNPQPLVPKPTFWGRLKERLRAARARIR